MLCKQHMHIELAAISDGKVFLIHEKSGNRCLQEKVQTSLYDSNITPINSSTTLPLPFFFLLFLFPFKSQWSYDPVTLLDFVAFWIYAHQFNFPLTPSFFFF